MKGAERADEMKEKRREKRRKKRKKRKEKVGKIPKRIWITSAFLPLLLFFLFLQPMNEKFQIMVT